MEKKMDLRTDNFSISSSDENDQYLRIGEEGKGIKIGFCRTLRIPDDEKIYPLPPSLGNFPLKMIEDYRESVPQSWLKEGGVFFPMYQREAMWINLKRSSFRDQKKRVVKIGVGNVNIVSGEKWTDNLQEEGKQDYVVIPDQPWIDGICSGSGYIRQFISMPLHQGYSIEEQIKGKEEEEEEEKLPTGGLQFICYGAKKAEEGQLWKDIMYAKPSYPPQFRVSVEKPTGTYTIFVRTLTGQRVPIGVFSTDTIDILKRRIEMKIHIPADQQRIVFSGIQMMDEYSVSDYYVGSGSTVYLVLRLRGGGEDPNNPQREMGVSSGGKIKQKVFKDKHGIEYWDQTKASKVVVRIVNSLVYEKITGEKPPESPVMSSRTYTENGLPWYDIYNEKLVDGVDKSDVLQSNVKTVKQIDQEKNVWPKDDNETVKIDGNQVVNIKKK